MLTFGHDPSLFTVQHPQSESGEGETGHASGHAVSKNREWRGEGVAVNKRIG